MQSRVEELLSQGSAQRDHFGPLLSPFLETLNEMEDNLKIYDLSRDNEYVQKIFFAFPSLCFHFFHFSPLFSRSFHHLPTLCLHFFSCFPSTSLPTFTNFFFTVPPFFSFLITVFTSFPPQNVGEGFRAHWFHVQSTCSSSDSKVSVNQLDQSTRVNESQGSLVETGNLIFDLSRSIFPTNFHLNRLYFWVL